MDITSLTTDWLTPNSDNYVRFWSYTRNFTSASSTELCLHFQQAYNLVHYSLNCPTHPMYRRRLDGNLLPEGYKLPNHHLTTSHHHSTTPERPPTNTTINNNKDWTEINTMWLYPKLQQVHRLKIISVVIFCPIYETITCPVFIIWDIWYSINILLRIFCVAVNKPCLTNTKGYL